MTGAFVTGTGTGVGKSIVAAALCAALVADGRRVVASKPLLSGLDEAPGTWPHDHDLLSLVTYDPAEEIAPHRFGPAVSPHLAARWAGVQLHVARLAAEVRDRAAAIGAQTGTAPTLVVEGAGGLLVPVDDQGATMADLAMALDLPLVIAAHPGLGTINHVQLTLEAARTRGLPVAGVVLTPWPEQPSPIDSDNRAFLTEVARAPVLALGHVGEPTAQALAAAGQAAGLASLA